MLTSLAPSPIARVVACGSWSLTMLTMSAFYLGETLHATTTDALNASFKNSSLILSFELILMSESPATITAVFLAHSINFY
jgi:hypothetical protein